MTLPSTATESCANVEHIGVKLVAIQMIILSVFILPARKSLSRLVRLRELSDASITHSIHLKSYSSCRPPATRDETFQPSGHQSREVYASEVGQNRRS